MDGESEGCNSTMTGVVPSTVELYHLSGVVRITSLKSKWAEFAVETEGDGSDI